MEVTLKFEDIRYFLRPSLPVEMYYRARGRRTETFMKQILHGISGEVKPRTCLAIMGPSGCGKTTLLDILARRKGREGLILGDALVNDAKCGIRQFRRLSAYVQQSDILWEQLSVKETLMYAARFRLDNSNVSREEAVTKVMKQLGLAHVAGSQVGGVLKRGVSGGEKRRVSIGQQMVTDPKLLFLDEPTSGLDGFSALSVMDSIVNLAEKEHKTVICTIHQPRSNIFQRFDQLLLLAKGNVMYYGPGAGVVTYFAALNLHCPSFTNPADFMLDVVSNASTVKSLASAYKLTAASKSGEFEHELESVVPPSADSASRHVSSAAANDTDKNDDGGYQQYLATGVSTTHESVMAVTDTRTLREERQNSRDNVLFQSEYASSWIMQLFWLYLRSLTIFVRNPIIMIVRTTVVVLGAFLVSFTYLQLTRDQSAVNSRVGAIFFSEIFLTLSSLPAIAQYITDKAVFDKERAAGFYRTSTYFIARSLVDLPVLILLPFLFSIIMYPLTNLNLTVESFVWFVFFATMCFLIGDSMCQMISVLLPLVNPANACAALLFSIYLLYCGYLIAAKNIRWYVKIFYYISFWHYSHESMVYNELHDTSFHCTDTEYVCFPGGETCPTTSGNDALKSFNYTEVSRVADAVVLLLMLLIYKFLAYCFLRFLHVKK